MQDAQLTLDLGGSSHDGSAAVHVLRPTQVDAAAAKKLNERNAALEWKFVSSLENIARTCDELYYRTEAAALRQAIDARRVDPKYWTDTTHERMELVQQLVDDLVMPVKLKLNRQGDFGGALDRVNRTLARAATVQSAMDTPLAVQKPVVVHPIKAFFQRATKALTVPSKKTSGVVVDIKTAARRQFGNVWSLSTRFAAAAAFVLVSVLVPSQNNDDVNATTSAQASTPLTPVQDQAAANVETSGAVYGRLTDNIFGYLNTPAKSVQSSPSVQRVSLTETAKTIPASEPTAKPVAEYDNHAAWTHVEQARKKLVEGKGSLDAIQAALAELQQASTQAVPDSEAHKEAKRSTDWMQTRLKARVAYNAAHGISL